MAKIFAIIKAGRHQNRPHWLYGPLFYLGARFIGHAPLVGAVRPLAALLIVLLVGVVNDRADYGTFGKSWSGYAYAAWEILNFFPVTLAVCAADLVVF